MAAFGDDDIDPNARPVRFDPIPAGTYTLVIIDSDVLPTKDGTGKRMTIKVEVVAPDGPHVGRKWTEGINLKNASEKAQAIGQGQIAALLQAVGLKQHSNMDTAELHGIPFPAKVAVVPEKNGFPAKNEIKAFLKPGESTPPQQTAAAQSGEKKPWSRK